jgi:outer membrane protein OmpA-like peptidoglycan-associated protein
MRTRPLICAALAALLVAPPAFAGLGDAIKKAGKKATDAVEGTKPAPPAAPAKAPEGEHAEGDGGKVSAVSTKFDYIPGDSVLFLDDFTGDDLGEFPHQWSLAQGNFEIAELKGERWLRGVSDDGRIRLKLPVKGPLPELWTLEFDILGQDPMDQAFIVRALGDDEKYAWESTFPGGTNAVFRSGSIFSSTPLESGTVPGRHHLAFMARGKAIKAYIDRQRFASVPEIEASAGPPQAIEIRMFASSKPMITNVRFALGPKPAKDLLASGKLVTHGIHFDTGSDVVLPDSAPVLRQVAAWMTANPAAKLKVTGHTDNVGSAASNLDLSKRRAASVARVLSGELGVAPDRFETDGKGDTQAMSSNANPEGRAMNRRVEFAKL